MVSGVQIILSRWNMPCIATESARAENGKNVRSIDNSRSYVGHEVTQCGLLGCVEVLGRTAAAG